MSSVKYKSSYRFFPAFLLVGFPQISDSFPSFPSCLFLQTWNFCDIRFFNYGTPIPFLVSIPAHSLPMTPTWVGIHWNAIFYVAIFSISEFVCCLEVAVIEVIYQKSLPGWLLRSSPEEQLSVDQLLQGKVNCFNLTVAINFSPAHWPILEEEAAMNFCSYPCLNIIRRF